MTLDLAPTELSQIDHTALKQAVNSLENPNFAARLDPKLEVVKDTLTGTLEYAGQLVAMGTMGYKHEAMAGNGEATLATLSKTQINLKLIPGVDGHAEVCQLVAINLIDIVVKGSWVGPGRLHLVPHVNAPVADFPVRRVIGAHHYIADLSLPYGRVVFDYNKKVDAVAQQAAE